MAVLYFSLANEIFLSKKHFRRLLRKLHAQFVFYNVLPDSYLTLKEDTNAILQRGTYFILCSV